MSDLTFRVKVLLDFLIYSPKGRILINGYYNKISVNQVAAYNAGTAAGYNSGTKAGVATGMVCFPADGGTTVASSTATHKVSRTFPKGTYKYWVVLWGTYSNGPAATVAYSGTSKVINRNTSGYQKGAACQRSFASNVGCLYTGSFTLSNAGTVALQIQGNSNWGMNYNIAGIYT